MLKKASGILLSVLLMVSCSQTGQNQNNDISQLNQDSTISSKSKFSKPNVILMESPNQNDRPSGVRPDTIILHHTASAAEAKNIGKFFQNPESKVSAHYTVDRTGYVVQSVDDSKRSWHAGKSQFQGRENVNDFSIGIEICNIGDNKDPYPDAEYDSIIKLVGYLMTQYNIPAKNITRHKDIALPAGRKDDTSESFSVQRVLNGVHELLNGTYKPTIKTEKALSYPDFREVKLDEKLNLKEIADSYLDAETRWEELLLLNPSLNEKSVLQSGTKIKLPLNFKYWEQLKK
ncbi:MAG: N-acetylmuramoyl-L-alanine amidase [Cyanobacteriota bacterium]